MVISSLKSHYILSSVLLFIAIVVVLAFTSYNVSISSKQSLKSVDNRRVVQQSSAHIRDSIWETDSAINAYVLISSDKNKKNLQLNLNDLTNSIEKLMLNSWGSTKRRLRLLNQLNEKVVTMKRYINSLIELREDRSKRFPTLSILEDALYPINIEFITVNTLAINDIDLTNISKDELEYFNLISSTLRLWHRMISSFRLFVAYRTETLNNPVSGMINELSDIETLYYGVKDNLQNIKDAEKNNVFYQDNRGTTEELMELADSWYNNFKIVGEIHTSDEWRKDDVIIREQLQPVSQSIRKLLYKLDTEIDQSFQQDIYSLTNLASSIIWNIWLLGILTLIFISMGYFYIQKHIVNPIYDVAEGLKIQKTENKQIALPDTTTSEINTLVAAFNELSHSLASAEAVVRHTDKMATVGELASCVAHEINNPLHNMSMIVQLAREEVANNLPETELNNDIKILQHEIDRCAAIVKNLLDFGRLKEPSIEKISITTILDESIQLLNHKAGIKHININSHIAPDLPDVEADPSQIHQVFVNLILNAIDFSPKGGTINVTIEQQNHQLICNVTDEGKGVDDFVIEKLFDPFYTTRKGHEGMGLGLSVCYGIIQSHRGEIGAHSDENNGLTVWFTLPISIHKDINT